MKKIIANEDEEIYLKKITVKGFLIVNYNIKKDYILDFEKNKIVIVGNNGLGKTSLINLIFGIITNKINLFAHVRYDEITFEFSDKDIRFKSNYTFKSFDEIDSVVYNREISLIKKNFFLMTKWLHLFNDKKIEEEILEEIKTIDEIKINNFIQKIHENIKSKSDLLNKENYKISELSDVININNATPWKFFNRIIENILQQINIINSNMLNNYDNYGKHLQEINFRLKNNIDYFSSFRNVKEFINNKRRNDNYFNSKNLIMINFELDKNDIDKILEGIIKKINEKINEMKSSFFKIIANNEWNKNNFNIEEMEKLSKIINDEDIKNLLKNIKKDKEFKEKIQGFLGQFVGITKEFKKFKGNFKIFMEAINECLNNKKISYKDNNFLIEIGNVSKPFSKDELSSGEKQIFLILQSLFLSDKKIIIIDEPENSLSIRWQQIVQNSFEQLSRTKKLIIITHSPYMINQEDISDKRFITFK